MISKEVKLSLSFFGALTAIVLISAPVNSTISLYASGIALLVASGFFYSGLENYFADKANELQIANQQRELAIKNSNDQFVQFQNLINEQLKLIVEELENLNDSAKPIADMANATTSTIPDKLSVMKSSADQIESNTSKLRDLQKTTKSILENLDEVSKIEETLQSLIKTLSLQEEFYKTYLSQYQNVTARDAELIENLARKLR